MNFNFYILIVVSTLSACVVEAEDSRVIGGKNATQRYPYQVSLQLRTSANSLIQSVNGWSHNCGGSIVSNRFVLTAAHCVAARSLQIINLSIWAGTQQLDGFGVRYYVESTLRHPKYVPLPLHSSDIGIVKSKETIVFVSDKIQPITYSNEVIKGGVMCTLTGWGFMNNKRVGGPANNLQEIQLPTISNTQCEWDHIHITEGDVCTFSTSGEGQCGGDSGGPLAKGNLLVGIVSHGTSVCAIGISDVYTRVSTFYNWIQANTQV